MYRNKPIYREKLTLHKMLQTAAEKRLLEADRDLIRVIYLLWQDLLAMLKSL